LSERQNAHRYHQFLGVAHLSGDFPPEGPEKGHFMRRLAKKHVRDYTPAMLDSRRLLDATFTTGDIAAAVGVSRSVVADWMARKVISAPQTPGRGRRREFGFWNIVEASIAHDLNKIGIRAGSISTILTIAHTELFEFNTALKTRGGQEDCVLLIGFGSEGLVDWIKREGPDERSGRVELSEAVIVLRIDVNAAMGRVTASLRKHGIGV
jgi:hypothetical protein